jgi:hypothetical protein
VKTDVFTQKALGMLKFSLLLKEKEHILSCRKKKPKDFHTGRPHVSVITTLLSSLPQHISDNLSTQLVTASKVALETQSQPRL